MEHAGVNMLKVSKRHFSVATPYCKQQHRLNVPSVVITLSSEKLDRFIFKSPTKATFSIYCSRRVSGVSQPGQKQATFFLGAGGLVSDMEASMYPKVFKTKKNYHKQKETTPTLGSSSL